MNTRTRPDEATPLTHDLGDPLIHEEREAPVSLRKPSLDYITLLVATDAGVPMAIAKEWLEEMGLSSPPAGRQEKQDEVHICSECGTPDCFGECIMSDMDHNN